MSKAISYYGLFAHYPYFNPKQSVPRMFVEDCTSCKEQHVADFWRDCTAFSVVSCTLKVTLNRWSGEEGDVPSSSFPPTPATPHTFSFHTFFNSIQHPTTVDTIFQTNSFHIFNFELPEHYNTLLVLRRRRPCNKPTINTFIKFVINRSAGSNCLYCCSE